MKEFTDNLFDPNNKFFLLTKDAKRLTHIGLSSFILPLIIIILSGILVHFVFSPLYFGSEIKQNSFLDQGYELAILFITVVLFLFLWIRFYEKRSFSSIGLQSGNAFKKYITGFTIGFLMNSFVIGLIALMGGVQIELNFTTINGWNEIFGITIFLAAYIIQGGSEEILTRGWMFQVIGSRYKPWIGVLISSFFFTVLHLGNAGINIIGTINLFLVSILLIFFVMKYESIWTACGWHSAWNWTLANIFGLSVSGSGEKVSVLNLKTAGNQIISGGNFGPEASIVTTFVFLIVIFISVEINRKKSVRILHF